MSTRYLVKRIEQCPACNGIGYCHDPLWLRAEEAGDTAYNAIMAAADEDTADEDACFSVICKANGAAMAAIAAFWAERGIHNRRKWPPAEKPCDQCHGTGLLETDYDLWDALVDLGLLTCRAGEPVDADGRPPRL